MSNSPSEKPCELNLGVIPRFEWDDIEDRVVDIKSLPDSPDVPEWLKKIKADLCYGPTKDIEKLCADWLVKTPTEKEVCDKLKLADPGTNSIFAKIGFGGMTGWKSREFFVKNYAYALPTLEAIQKIISYGKILEIGCGSGFWARMLKDNGCDIIATTVDKYYIFPKRFIDVKIMRGHKAVKKFPNRTVLHIWPPMNGHWFLPMLDRVDRYIYVGELQGGCTGNVLLHQKLKDDFNLVDIFYIPQWYGLHDNMFIYERKY